MSIFSFTSFAATGAAPVALGFLSEHYDFRANNWVMLALSSILFLVIYFFMEETRSSVLLSRRAELIRKETGDYRWRSRGEIEQGQTSLSKTMKTNLKRPVKMLISEPILYSFTGYVTFVWIILYLGLGGIPIGKSVVRIVRIGLIIWVPLSFWRNLWL